MVIDDRPEDTGPAPDSGRAKRAPPTIDLEASEVSGETRNASGEAQPEPTSEPAARERAAGSAPVSSWVIAMISGAVAASLAIAVAWILGWPPVPLTPPVAPQIDTAVIDGLAARVASVESKTSKPPASVPDPAAVARIETLEKSIAALRSELAAARTQSDKLAADVKAMPRERATPGESSAALDLSGINERIAQIERATRAQGAEIAQENAKPADDVPLRRIVAAALLDVQVRIGDPYPAALAAARSLTDNADALKPLDAFATSGVPSVANLSRELLTLVPNTQLIKACCKAGQILPGVRSWTEAKSIVRG